MELSQEYIDRCNETSRQKYEWDLECNMAMEYKNGFEEGKEIKLREIAEKLLANGYSVEKVVQYTELSREDVEKINIEKNIDRTSSASLG